jgi:hypothetical protein
MQFDRRYIKAYRGDRWTDKLSFESLGEGDVFCLFEADGTKVYGELDGRKHFVFRATTAPRREKGIWKIETAPYTGAVPEVK